MCVLSGDHPELTIIRHKKVRPDGTEPSAPVELGWSVGLGKAARLPE